MYHWRRSSDSGPNQIARKRLRHAEGDDFEVRVSELEIATGYELHTTALNGSSAAFDRDCTDFRETDDIIWRGAVKTHTVYGCIPLSTSIWSWVEDEDGDADDETVNISFGTLPSTVSGAGSPSSATLTIEDDDPPPNNAPTISGPDSKDYAENGKGAVATYTANDPDGDTITWSLSGDDSGHFTISSGVLSFTNPPDFEARADSDRNNKYKVTVTARDDNGGSDSITVTINVTNVNEAPVVSGRTTVNYAENGTGNVDSFTASDPEGDAVTWTLGGDDHLLFALSFPNPKRTSPVNLKFKTSPDYENPADNGPNNVYDLSLKASDGPLDSPSVTIAVTVTDVNEPPSKPSAPTVTSNGETSLSVAWSAPTNTGPPINDYDVQYRAGNSGPFTSATHTGVATQTTISGLSPDTSYEVQVRATNAEGTSDWSDSGTGATDTPPPTPTPTPTATPIPTLRIEKVTPGMTSVFVKLAWAPAQPSQTDLKSLKIEWEQKSGILCGPLACAGSATVQSPADLAHVIRYKDGSAQERAFVEDSDYVFKAVATLSAGNDEVQVESADTSKIRTHPVPRITHVDAAPIEPMLLSEYESWRVYTRASVALGSTVSVDAPDFAIEALAATDVQVKDKSGDSCVWGNRATSPTLLWKPSGFSHYLARCGIGDDGTQLTIKTRVTENGVQYTLDEYTVTLKQTWHQRDHVVEYRLGTPIPTPTPMPTPTGFTTPPVDVPEAVSTAIAIWGTAVPSNLISFCAGDSCPNGIGSEEIVVNVATPLPTPAPPVTENPSLIPGCLPATACVKPWFHPPHVGNQSLVILHPALWYDDTNKSGILMLKETIWVNDAQAAQYQSPGGDTPFGYLPVMIAHELGHAAGLGHSPNPRDVMYERIQFQTSLTSRDTEAMKSNYEGHRPHR